MYGSECKMGVTIFLPIVIAYEVKSWIWRFHHHCCHHYHLLQEWFPCLIQTTGRIHSSRMAVKLLTNCKKVYIFFGYANKSSFNCKPRIANASKPGPNRPQTYQMLNLNCYHDAKLYQILYHPGQVILESSVISLPRRKSGKLCYYIYPVFISQKIQ